MMLFSGEEIIAVVFGSRYGSSADIALLLCIGRLLQSLIGLPEMLLLMTGGERTYCSYLMLVTAWPRRPIFWPSTPGACSV